MEGCFLVNSTNKLGFIERTMFMNRFLYYLGWTIAIGFIIYLGATYQIRLEQEASKTFNLMKVLLFQTIFSVVIGMLFRLPKFIIGMKQKTEWTFDWIKFLAIGGSSLFILLIYVFIFFVPESVLPLIPQTIFLGSQTIQMLAGVVFGFVLVDSLNKQKNLQQ